MGNTISAATASWYSGTGMAPSDCAASMQAYRRGRLSPTITMCWPRDSPASAMPPASAATSSANSRQVVVCQMPYSFSRRAGAWGRAFAWSSIRRGKVVSNAVSLARGVWLDEPVLADAGYLGALARREGMLGLALTPSCRSGDIPRVVTDGTFHRH